MNDFAVGGVQGSNMHSAGGMSGAGMHGGLGGADMMDGAQGINPMSQPAQSEPLRPASDVGVNTFNAFLNLEHDAAAHSTGVGTSPMGGDDIRTADSDLGVSSSSDINTSNSVTNSNSGESEVQQGGQDSLKLSQEAKDITRFYQDPDGVYNTVDRIDSATATIVQDALNKAEATWASGEQPESRYEFTKQLVESYRERTGDTLGLDPNASADEYRFEFFNRDTEGRHGVRAAISEVYNAIFNAGPTNVLKPEEPLNPFIDIR